MANIYVSQQRGNDTRTKTEAASQSTPWATINKAVANVAAGDIVYIGPGRYQEKITLAYPGTVGNDIIWQGDPDCWHLTSDTPGPVRVTGCDANDMPTAGAVWNFNAHNYNTVRNLDIDGSSNMEVACYGTSTLGTTCVLENCCLHGFYGVNWLTQRRCFVLAGGWAAQQSHSTNCVLIGGDHALSAGAAYNCILIGGNTVPSADVTLRNCVILGCANNSTSGVTIGNSLAMGCGTAYSAPTLRVWSGLTGGTASKAVLLDGRALMRAFEPVLGGGLIDGGNNTHAPATDMLGRPSQMGSGTVDIGPWELSSVVPQWAVGTYHTAPPGLRINRKGVQIFEVPVKNGTAMSISVKVKHIDTLSSLYPQLILGRIGLDGLFETIATATAAAAANTWETLTLSFTPTRDEVLEARIYARDPAAASYSLFSDFVIG